ncbi:MAG: acyltransferase [Chitinispirillaceae bacterium]|jgi:peptidoglycan/LPS O-acetylase OafA/YrhL|nr:acyltransferase [Chitinispirillaceae bacterium]
MDTHDQTLPRTARLASLDFLRGAAILLVLFHHQPFFAPLQKFGWTGVNLFFVLSGFLVSGLLFAEYRDHGTIQPLRFLIRRGFKIYPGYYALILATVIVSLASVKLQHDGSAFLDPKALRAECLFLQNYLGGIYVHTWSLAVEEHFYFAVAVGIAFAGRFGLLDRKRLFPSLLIALLCLCLALRIRQWITVPYSWETHFVQTHLRFDGLVFGMLLSYWYHFENEALVTWYAKAPLLTALGASACLTPALFLDPSTPFMYTAGLSLLYIGFGLSFLAMLLDPRIEKKLRTILTPAMYNGIVKIGFYSYTIYLWHMFIIKYVFGFLDHRHLLALDYHFRFVIYAALSIGLGVFMARLIELPLLALRNRYVPAPARIKEDTRRNLS